MDRERGSSRRRAVGVALIAGILAVMPIGCLRSQPAAPDAKAKAREVLEKRRADAEAIRNPGAEKKAR